MYCDAEIKYFLNGTIYDSNKLYGCLYLNEETPRCSQLIILLRKNRESVCTFFPSFLFSKEWLSQNLAKRTVFQYDPRTTNFLEAWNWQFISVVGEPHLNIYKFLVLCVRGRPRQSSRE